jgi:hypothetical protein
MSEYQYYEFLAIDRPLTNEQMREVRESSGRAKITPRSFVNEYNFGDFRGNVNVFLTKYFDAFVYVANWGTHRLSFRLPKTGWDMSATRPYFTSDYMDIDVAGKYAILEFWSEDDESGWEESGGWMSSLSPLRGDILAGDFRSLYLGWLSSIAGEGTAENENEIEPPVPPGLGDLSAPQKALVEFLRVDASLIEAAAEASPPLAQGDDRTADLGSWINMLSSVEKDAFLFRFAREAPAAVQREMMWRFRRERNAGRELAAPGRRSVGQLLAAWNQRTQEKQRRAAEKRAREEARRREEAAKTRQVRLDELAGKGPQAWRQVDSLIQTRRPKKYDAAVDLLRDLRDLAEREGRAPEAAARIGAVRRAHDNKPSLLRRLDEARL